MSADVDVYELTNRWAQLLSENPDRMVEDIYSPDVAVVHAGREPEPVAIGREGFRRADLLIRQKIPNRRVDVVRVTPGDAAVIVEGVVIGASSGDPGLMASPFCQWWRLDDEGLVAHETDYWEWAKRRAYSGAEGGTILHGDGRARPAEWYRERAARLADLWTADPSRMVEELYTEDCLVERLGEGQEAIFRGADDLVSEGEVLLGALPPPDRRMRVTEVSAFQDVLAIAFTIEGRWMGQGPFRRGPGCIVLTMGPDDRAISGRIYWHWSRARAVPEADGAYMST